MSLGPRVRSAISGLCVHEKLMVHDELGRLVTPKLLRRVNDSTIYRRGPGWIVDERGPLPGMEAPSLEEFFFEDGENYLFEDGTQKHV